MANAKAYTHLPQSAFRGNVKFTSDSIKVALLSSGYTPDQDNHVNFSDVNTYEVTGTGYTAGGATLANKTDNLDLANNVLILSADNVTWATSTITARYAVVYDSASGSAATSPLLGYVDFVSDQASNAGNFVIQWDATGILRLTVA